MKIALNKSKQWKNICRSNWNAFHYNAINTKHPYRVICLMSSLVEKRNDSFCVFSTYFRCFAAQFTPVSPCFWLISGNTERGDLERREDDISLSAWVSGLWGRYQERGEKKKKTPFNVFFFFHVRAVKHPRRSGYYFNEGCGWINTAAAQWCLAAESVTSSRKQIHIQQTGFVFVFFFPPRITRTTVFLLTSLDERVAPLLQIRRIKAGVREATAQHVRWEIFLQRALWHQNRIWRFENVQRKTRLFLRWKQMDLWLFTYGYMEISCFKVIIKKCVFYLCEYLCLRGICCKLKGN